MRPAFVFDAYGTLYDVQSVSVATEAAFPGRGELITQLWRLKQLEYTWLRSVMGDFRDFAVVTADALRFTLRSLGLDPAEATVASLCDAYLDLAPYPEASAALASLAPAKRAILSNGSAPMLAALVRNSGLGTHLDVVLSADAVRVYKPAAAVYALVEPALGLAPADIVFVSSNPFDVAGAKRFGFKVAWIERVAALDLMRELAGSSPVGPATLFKLLRTRPDELGQTPDWTIGKLTDLAAL